MEYTRVLQKIACELEEIRGIALAGMDGLIVAELRIHPGTDLSALAAEYSSTIRRAKEIQRGLALGSVSEFCLFSDQTDLLFRILNEHFFLVLVLENGSNSGKGRYVLKREAETLAKVL